MRNPKESAQTKIGRALEPALSSPVIAALKKCGGQPEGLENEEEKSAVLEALARLCQSPPFAASAAALRQSKGPLYEADPNHPDAILRVNEDGSRTPGQFVGRQFLAAEEA